MTNIFVNKPEVFPNGLKSKFHGFNVIYFSRLFPRANFDVNFSVRN